MILVLAADHAQAHAWATSHDLRPTDWTHIAHSKTMAKFRGYALDVIELDGFATHPEADAIYAAAGPIAASGRHIQPDSTTCAARTCACVSPAVRLVERQATLADALRAERSRKAQRIYEYQAYQAAQLAWDLGIDAVTADLFDAWMRPATDHEIATSFDLVRHLTGRSRNHWREEDCRLQIMVLAVVKFSNGSHWDRQRERLAHLVTDTRPRRWRVRYSSGRGGRSRVGEGMAAA